MDSDGFRPPAGEVVRVSQLPYIVPTLEHGLEYPDHLVVEVDHTGAAAGRRGVTDVRDLDRGVPGPHRRAIRPADGIGAVLRYAPTLHETAG